MPKLLAYADVDSFDGGLYSRQFEDCYFQPEDPLGEIEHVFLGGTQLEKGWDSLCQSGQPFCLVAETGFGSGLNFFVTWFRWREWRRRNPHSSMQLHFVSTEIAPLPLKLLRALYQKFPNLLPLFQQCESRWPPPWQGCHCRRLPDQVILSVLYGDSIEMLKSHQFQADAWYLDGFAPSRNRGMWCDELYQQIAHHSRPGARIATFTAAGHVRRGLEAVGFQLQRQPGFNKRHMTHGVFGHPLNSEFRREDVAIIGAGYAGLHAADCFARLGHRVKVFDRGANPCAEASGNSAHVLYLKPRLIQNEFNHFFEQAYSYSVSHYLHQSGVYSAGVLHDFPDSEKESWTADAIRQAWPDDWLRLLSLERAAAVAGISTRACLFMPKGLVIHPYVWGQSMRENLEQFGVEFHFNSPLERIYSGTNQLQLKQGLSEGFDRVVLATGVGSFQLLHDLGNKCVGPDSKRPSHWRYPLRPIAGQSTIVQPERIQEWPFTDLKTAICARNYVVPKINGFQTFGSQFLPDQFDSGVQQDSHLANCVELIESFRLAMTPEQILAGIVGGHSATRVQTTDYLPMVGPIFPETYPHIYMVCGFGAKGSLVSPYVCAALVHSLYGGAPVASNSILAQVAPGRFAARFGVPH